MIEFDKGPMKRDREFYEKAGRERAINELKQAGWRMTTDLPFVIMDNLKDDPTVRIGSQGTLGTHMYGFMAEILTEEGEEYEAQNTKMVGRSKFLSPDFARKVEEKAKARFRRKGAAE